MEAIDIIKYLYNRVNDINWHEYDKDTLQMYLSDELERIEFIVKGLVNENKSIINELKTKEKIIDDLKDELKLKEDIKDLEKQFEEIDEENCKLEYKNKELTKKNEEISNDFKIERFTSNHNCIKVTHKETGIFGMYGKHKSSIRNLNEIFPKVKEQVKKYYDQER